MQRNPHSASLTCVAAPTLVLVLAATVLASCAAGGDSAPEGPDLSEDALDVGPEDLQPRPDSSVARDAGRASGPGDALPLADHGRDTATMPPDSDLRADAADAGPAPLLFSFAILTDLHIGEGHRDYGSPGWDDEGGVEDALCGRVREAVAKVNAHRDELGIEVAMVLGDLSDSAERSELQRAKRILQGLRVPWLPLLGNHDMWPYVRVEGGYEESQHAIGAEVFWEVFADVFAGRAEQLDGLTLAVEPVLDPVRQRSGRYIDFAFDLHGWRFVVADFVTRQPAPPEHPGVGPEADLHDFPGGPWPWLVAQLESRRGPAGGPVFVFTHHPPVALEVDSLSAAEHARIDDLIRSGGHAEHLWGFFAGHWHVDVDATYFSGQRVVVTASAKEQVRVRVVRVFADGSVDPGLRL